jgi:hypothetical protein
MFSWLHTTPLVWLRYSTIFPRTKDNCRGNDNFEIYCRQLADQKHGERVESAWNVAGSCDVSLLVIDAFRQYCRPDPRIVDLVGSYQNILKIHGSNNVPKAALVLTKVDKLLTQDTDFSQMADDLLKISRMNTMFLVSGLRGGCKIW